MNVSENKAKKRMEKKNDMSAEKMENMWGTAPYFARTDWINNNNNSRPDSIENAIIRDKQAIRVYKQNARWW